jgi:hypothetical protein
MLKICVLYKLRNPSIKWISPVITHHSYPEYPEKTTELPQVARRERGEGIFYSLLFFFSLLTEPNDNFP